MKLPRKGILIRLAIYAPVIGALSYQAFCTPEEPPAPDTNTDPAGGPRVRHLQGPDGATFKVIEVTPEQAEAMGVQMPESSNSG